MGRTRLLALVALCLSLAAPAAAQETQVPLDEAGRVLTVDLPLARRLGLWVDDHPDFQEARLFRRADSTFVLEVTTLRQGQTGRQRISLSAADVAALRRDVTARIAARPAPLEMDQRGRYLLLGQTTLAGLVFYGPALPYVLDMEGSSAGGVYLLTAGVSYFLPFALTQGRPITYGMANLSRYGITRGIAHGMLLHNALFGEPEEVIEQPVCAPEQPRPCEVVVVDDGEERRRLAFGLVGSLAEGIGGYLWARNERMTAGTANAIGLGGDAGLLWGLGTADLVGLDSDDERAFAIIGLGSSAAGIVAGRALAARRNYVWGDVEVMYTGGLVGAWAGFATTAGLDGGKFDGDGVDDEVYTAVTMGASALGLYVADRLVRDTDFTVGQSTLNRLGSLAGGLAGASVGLFTDSPEAALIGSAVGAVGGFYGTYLALAPEARGRRGDVLSGLDVGVAPDVFGRRALLTARYRFGGSAGR